MCCFKSNTFNILISLVSSDCDLAKFFLLIHFTATSKSCFFTLLEEKEEEEAVRSVWNTTFTLVVKSEIYLFVSAFEHNGEGPMANQVLPAKLKPSDRLHGSLVNCC